MLGFEWAEHNLGATSPHELQGRGINVFFAPNVSPGVKLVSLADGRVEHLQEGEQPPEHGYYADFESLERYCRKHDIAFTETSGIVSTI